MKALILAAGIGTRLIPHTNNTPKCLLKVGGKELLDYQLDALVSSGINEIFIVTGYLSDKIRNKAGNKAKFVNNPFYNKYGILYSFQVAKKLLYDKEFVCLSSDILFNPEILDIVLRTKGDIVIGVEKKICDDEDTKAIISNGEIIKTGKSIRQTNKDESIAEFVHIFKFSRNGSKIFFENVDSLIESGNHNALMVDALNATIERSIKIIPAYTNGFQRIEIDFIGDLEKARNLRWS